MSQLSEMRDFKLREEEKRNFLASSYKMSIEFTRSLWIIQNYSISSSSSLIEKVISVFHFPHFAFQLLHFPTPTRPTLCQVMFSLSYHTMRIKIIGLLILSHWSSQSLITTFALLTPPYLHLKFLSFHRETGWIFLNAFSMTSSSV